MSTVIKSKDGEENKENKENKENIYLIQFDGGAQPNPGECAGAYVIFDSNKNKKAEGGIYFALGTNNVGEYNGLLLGLKMCISLNIKRIKIEGDSNLVISQISGKWKVKDEKLKVICQKIIDLFVEFDYIECSHIRREYNIIADSLSDYTLSIKRDWKHCMA